MSPDAIIGIVGVVVGTILGAIFSDLGSRLKECREEKQLSKSVRKIVSIEIDQNIDLIKRKWEILNRPAGGDDLLGVTSEESKYRAIAYFKQRRVTRYIDLPLPK